MPARGPLDQWTLWMRALGASPNTIRTRIGGVRSLLEHAGRTDPVSFTTADVIAWLADCQSDWTRRTYATTVRAWHRWLVEQGIREDDPTEVIPPVKQPRGIPRPAPTHAVDAALAIAARRARAYIELAAYEGLRVHEIAKVQGEDFEDGWLFVRGKGDEVDAVPIHPAVEMLRVGFPATGWWFPSDRGPDGHVTGKSVSRTISDTFQKAGFKISAHQLRHWFGTHALRVSKDLRVVQELMRHASVSSTQIYTHAADQTKAATVRRLSLRTTGVSYPIRVVR